MKNNQGEIGSRDESLYNVAPHSGMNPFDSILDETTKAVDLKMEQLNKELDQSDDFILSMSEQNMVPNVEKKDPKIEKHRLRQKYKEALKRDEKLEAEAERSINEPNVILEEHQAELKKRHKSQVKVFQAVQEKMMASFKKDMDNLMRKFDAEYSRLRKVHSDLLADNQKKQENNSAISSSTHQP
ncbi:uncharacterized protein LOC108099584 [Drosophila ficusphila]|uniref:uncharacterized protein LOC108099584 n=1 Tax=Drosophila ficusphila TaxID=30025 RepID=UPI0007E6FEE4|nr:uncharacterized protein LOC108099584 [Drosophila ficusphila]